MALLGVSRDRVEVRQSSGDLTFSLSKPDYLSLPLGCLISVVVVGLIRGGGGWIFLCLDRKKFSGLGSGGKKISGFVFKFVGWVCIYVVCV